MEDGRARWVDCHAKRMCTRFPFGLSSPRKCRMPVKGALINRPAASIYKE